MRIRIPAIMIMMVLFAACASAPPTSGPASSPLNQTIAAIWEPASIPRGSNVTWHVGTPPVGYAAFTSWTCVVVCSFDIVVDSAYVTNQQIIGHEGGHVICMSLYYDGSEACADANNPRA